MKNHNDGAQSGPAVRCSAWLGRTTSTQVPKSKLPMRLRICRWLSNLAGVLTCRGAAVTRTPQQCGDNCPPSSLQSTESTLVCPASEHVLHSPALTCDDLKDVERRSAEYRRFLSCDGRLPIKADELSEVARLAIIDVPLLINALRSNAEVSESARKSPTP